MILPLVQYVYSRQIQTYKKDIIHFDTALENKMNLFSSFSLYCANKIYVYSYYYLLCIKSLQYLAQPNMIDMACLKSAILCKDVLIFVPDKRIQSCSTKHLLPISSKR